MSAHEAIAALPAASNANHALIRAMATRRFAYCLDRSEDVTALDVVDPADGTLPLYLVQNNTLFEYDSTDSTTAHDGTTCLVTNDAKRYKTLSVALPYSVINSTTTAQPVSPTVGDSYRVATGATGTDWAGEDGKIAVYTARGWVFIVAPIGWLLHDEDGECFYHKDASGTWTLGFGTQALAAGSVLPSMMSGGGGKVRFFVENQTTNTPPVSPTDNVEYIIGSSPTGAWAGKAAQIARYENSAWVYYVPTAGWKVYDKNIAEEYRYDGSSWIKSAGAFTVVSHFYTSSTTWTKPARCFGVMVVAIGGGGGGAGTGSGGNAGSTTFGAYITANKGNGGSSSGTGGTGGTGSSADYHNDGATGAATGAGAAGGTSRGPYANNGAGNGNGGAGNGGGGGGGAGEYVEQWFDATSLTSSVAVTIGAAGGAGSGGGSAGIKGWMMVKEYISN